MMVQGDKICSSFLAYLESWYKKYFQKMTWDYITLAPFPFGRQQKWMRCCFSDNAGLCRADYFLIKLHTCINVPNRLRNSSCFPVAQPSFMLPCLLSIVSTQYACSSTLLVVNPYVLKILCFRSSCEAVYVSWLLQTSWFLQLCVNFCCICVHFVVFL